MQLIEKSDVSSCNEKRTIYTVQIGFNRFVDVMHVEHNDLFYVMQEEDGKCVFDTDKNTFATAVDENKILDFVIKHSM